MASNVSATEARSSPRTEGRRLSESGLAMAVKNLVIDRVRRSRGQSQERQPQRSVSLDSPPLAPYHNVFVPDDDGEDMDVVHVPESLVKGVIMLKVNAKTIKPRVFRLDPDRGLILWESKKSGIVAIENIKEIRTDGPLSAASAAFFRLHNPLWLSIIHVTGLKYRALNLIAPNEELRQLWITSLRALVRQRREMLGLPLALTIGSDESYGSTSAENGNGNGHGNSSDMLDAWERRRKAWLRRCWKNADADGSGFLEFPEVEALCWRLSVNSGNEDLKQMFDEADVTHRGSLDFADFRRFIALLRRRPDVQRIYKRVLQESMPEAAAFTWEVFLRFMRRYQGDTRTEEELQSVFKRYAIPYSNNPNPPNNSPTRANISLPPLSLSLQEGTPHLSIASFSSFLLSLDNSPMVESPSITSHAMDRPLAEYFISSSHNTYLIGHQLVGESTVEGYIRALLNGCRTVEMDLYDGDLGPVVTHGRTLTSNVPVRDVCHAIAKYAFVASPYPVIISAEIHCSVKQQDEVAAIMTAIFGDMLVRRPVSDEPLTELPSPEELKYRILLKAKNVYIATSSSGEVQQVELKTTDDDTSATDLSSISDLDARSPSPPLPSPPTSPNGRSSMLANFIPMRLKRKSSSDSDVFSMDDAAPKPLLEEGQIVAEPLSADIWSPLPLANSISPPPSANSSVKPKMSPLLVALLVYTVGVRWRGLNKKEHYAVEHMFSLSERSANKLMRNSMFELIKHNRTHLTRIYPSGTRLSSTNFEPQKYWACGSQLVALNWQTADLGLMINSAMFHRNGRCGYVLKPSALRLKDKSLLATREKLLFEVTIISAQQLPRHGDETRLGKHEGKSVMDPFVEVSVHVPDWPANLIETSFSRPPAVSPALSKTQTARTAVVHDNGFNPVWETRLSFSLEVVGGMRDVVFVAFAVRELGESDDNAPLAVYVTSLANLQPGYRHLPLHDVQMSPFLFSTLFVHTSVRVVP
ncbi:PLC-like phosphodiesterase [Calocera cornea HHB12733]|uniref:Phosphoinositide phospholipase C n=1 Tax=Calocera cornea HHB12733 TaxID=1353952 RepID=A0A165HZT6_9BASI|nr:PLC-like phosphodiesterase [Calocera cornea HHB12733]